MAQNAETRLCRFWNTFARTDLSYCVFRFRGFRVAISSDEEWWKKKKGFRSDQWHKIIPFFSSLSLFVFFLTLYLNSIRTGHLVVFEEISDPVIFCRLRIPLDKLLPRHPPSSSCAQQQVKCAGDRKHHRHPLPGYTNFIVCLYLRPALSYNGSVSAMVSFQRRAAGVWGGWRGYYFTVSPSKHSYSTCLRWETRKNIPSRPQKYKNRLS